MSTPSHQAPPLGLALAPPHPAPGGTKCQRATEGARDQGPRAIRLLSAAPVLTFCFSSTCLCSMSLFSRLNSGPAGVIRAQEEDIRWPQPHPPGQESHLRAPSPSLFHLPAPWGSTLATQPPYDTGPAGPALQALLEVVAWASTKRSTWGTRGRGDPSFPVPQAISRPPPPLLHPHLNRQTP